MIYLITYTVGHFWKNAIIKMVRGIDTIDDIRLLKDKIMALDENDGLVKNPHSFVITMIYPLQEEPQPEH